MRESDLTLLTPQNPSRGLFADMRAGAMLDLNLTAMDMR